MTVCWSRPTHLISRLSLCAGAPTSRPTWCILQSGSPRARRERGGDRSSHHRQFLPPVQEGAALGGIDPVLRMTLKLTILGCGTSGGVPRVGNIWGACDPANPKNRRRRCSVLVQKEGEEGTTNVLVDSSPDLREQLLDVGRRLARRRAFHPRPCRPYPRHR